MAPKTILLSLFAFALFASLSSATSTQCGLLNIDYSDLETITQGSSGGFTFTVYNAGESTQRVSASAVCDSRQLECSFTGVGDSTLIAPAQTLRFSLNTQSVGAAGSYQIPVEIRGGIGGSTTCTASTPLTLEVQSSISSAPSTPLTASITPDESVNARPGDAVIYTLTLTNNLNKRIYVSISSKGTNPFESTTSFSSSDVALEARQTKDVTVTVRLPPGTPGGAYLWIYYLDAGICCGYNFTLPVQEIRVQGPILNLQLLDAPLQDECTVVDAGQREEVEMALKNNGELTGPFTLAISGSRTVTNSVSISQTRVEPARGEQVPITLTIAPPLRTPLATYYYNLRGTYQGFTFLNRQFCFTVRGVETSSLQLPQQVIIERSRIATTTINITNNGSTTDEYALTPVQEGDLAIQPQPTSFRLTPGQTQTVTLTITSDLTTELGERTLLLTLDAQNYSKEIELNATVAATGKVGESLLTVTVDREIYIAPGQSKVVQVAVENIGQSVQRDVTLEVEGLDSALFSSESQTILPGETVIFELSLTLLQGLNQLPVNLTLQSGEEFVKTPLVLIASATANFEFTVDEIIENREGEITTSVDLLVTVRNAGLTPITQIGALINDVDYIYTQTPAGEFTLAGGESLQVRINVKPADRNVAAKNATLQFASAEGTSNPSTVVLPALTIPVTNLTWKAAIILLLLIGILLLLAKRD